MTRRPMLAALAAVLLLLGGACAGSTDEGDDSSSQGAAPGAMPAQPGEVDLSQADDSPFCQSFVRIVETLSEPGNTSDPARQQEVLRQLKTDYAAATDAAPSDIRVDIEITNQSVQEFSSLADMFFQPDAVTAAGDRVNAFVAANCGFDPADLDPSDPRG